MIIFIGKLYCFAGCKACGEVCVCVWIIECGFVCIYARIYWAASCVVRIVKEFGNTG